MFLSLEEYVSKVGFLDINIRGAEKSNLDGSVIPKSDGKFEVEGHSSCDIEASYFINPFAKLKDMVSLCTAVKHWLSFSWEFKSLSYFLSSHPFRSVWSQWAITVSSFSTFKVDVILKTRKGQYKYGDYASILKDAELLTVEDIEFFLLSDGYFRVSRGVFANKKDPLCLVMNESVLKFDLKDGWSSSMILNLLALYFSLAGYSLSVRSNRKTHHSFFETKIKELGIFIDKGMK